VSRYHKASDVGRNCPVELTPVDAEAAGDEIPDGEDAASGLAMGIFICIAVVVVMVTVMIVVVVVVFIGTTRVA